jgi:Lrp/AsnC family leucine-responsive transcriptional regulator
LGAGARCEGTTASQKRRVARRQSLVVSRSLPQIVLFICQRLDVYAPFVSILSMIDEMDRRILSLLQQDARLPNAEIARRVGMAPSATLERLRKLEERGVILGYEVRVDPRKLGLRVTAFIHVKAQDKQGELDTGERLKQHPNVLEVHHIAGEDCYLVKVRATDTEELGRMLRNDFSMMPSVRSTRTTIVLGTLKESARIPIPDETQIAIA